MNLIANQARRVRFSLPAPRVTKIKIKQDSEYRESIIKRALSTPEGKIALMNLPNVWKCIAK